MRENNLTSSTLYPGQTYQMPSGDLQSGDAALGQTTLNSDNTRLAALAQANVAAEANITEAWDAGVAQAAGPNISPSLAAAFDQELAQPTATGAPPAPAPASQQRGGFLAGVGNALFQAVYQPLAVTYDLEQVAYQAIGSAITGNAPDNIEYTSALGQAAANGAGTGELLYGMAKSAVLAPFNVGYAIGTAIVDGDAYEAGESLTNAALLFGAAKLGGADNVQLQSPLTVGDSVPSAFGQSGATSFRFQSPIVADGGAGGSGALSAPVDGAAYPEGLAYRADLPDHLAGPDGFTNSGQLSGTHNQQNAIAALDSQGATYTVSPTGTDGISQIDYSYVNSAGKSITGSKTVYDPSVYSDQTMLDMSQAAGQAGYESYIQNPSQRIFDGSQGGVNFRTYINIDPTTGSPYVGNVHPIR
jgi:hypothetical protein